MYANSAERKNGEPPAAVAACCCSRLLSTRYKAAMGYRPARRLMIPRAAVFTGILQHSHSTGFCSGATARALFSLRGGERAVASLGARGSRYRSAVSLRAPDASRLHRRRSPLNSRRRSRRLIRARVRPDARVSLFRQTAPWHRALPLFTRCSTHGTRAIV